MQDRKLENQKSDDKLIKVAHKSTDNIMHRCYAIL